MKAECTETIFENFVWIDIYRPKENDLNQIALEYNLDYYQILDSIETGHLPKFEKQDRYNFLILRAFSANLSERVTNINELSDKIAFFYSPQKLITIHSNYFKFLENIQRKFSDSEEFLVFIISKMIETFAEPSLILNDKIDTLEEIIFLKDYSKISLEDLYYLKSQTRISKKLLHITQNVINQIEVNDKYKSALQDSKDKLLNLILHYDEALEDSYNLLNTYLSVNSQKTNDVMKLLTIFSAFFLPLTFIAGLYGMNFENMPELKWELGYFITLSVMLVLAIIIYVWFKRGKIVK